MHWNRIYFAARATMLRPVDIYRGHLLFITMRIAMNAGEETVDGTTASPGRIVNVAGTRALTAVPACWPPGVVRVG